MHKWHEKHYNCDEIKYFKVFEIFKLKIETCSRTTNSVHNNMCWQIRKTT